MFNECNNDSRTFVKYVSGIEYSMPVAGSPVTALILNKQKIIPIEYTEYSKTIISICLAPEYNLVPSHELFISHSYEVKRFILRIFLENNWK